ncbi:hypothetical protein HDV00_007264 [Rhizophlyctis rosea]|nr:hypothetical protein HDV00_007264 [Rhizophlyctis rosea]
MLLGPDSPYNAWVMDRKTQRAAYVFLKRFLQAMHCAKAPESHWVLKAPQHAMWLEEMWGQFEGARVVFTGRDYAASVLGTCRLVTADLRTHLTTINLHAIGLRLNAMSYQNS